MPKTCVSPLLFIVVTSTAFCQPLRADVPALGDPPKAPPSFPTASPTFGVRALTVTGGFNVDTSSREQVRSFYNTVYQSSEGVPMDTTEVTASCTPGTNAIAFQNAELRRINWFRAMAGIPAAVTLDAGENTQDQAAALIMSANTAVQHVGIPQTWSCFSADGTNAAANSNLALGYDGSDAITGYIWDFGGPNYFVGHRRWMLYPQTQVMGVGDVPAQGGFLAANATWVFDANFGGPRPATRMPYVAWPPAGYVPYPVVYPQWSFALSNADFSSATVTMTSNKASIPVTTQPYVGGSNLAYGENTLVWYPSNLDPTSADTAFPFNGTDTVYSVTVSNVITVAGARNFAYTVTLFDPAIPGADYFPPVISGTNQPTVNAGNTYTCSSVSDPNVTGYQWLVSQTNNGNLLDGAEGGLGNFTATTTPGYPVITNLAGETGSHCFYLAMPVPPADQILQFNETLFPTTKTTLSFKSLLGYANTNQIAKVQVSADGGAIWQDVYSQTGSGGQGETTFTTRSLSLSNFAGTPVLLRFNYHFGNGSSGFFSTSTNPPVGWFLDNILVTNTWKLVNLVTNSTVSTNFSFTPSLPTNYCLQSRAVIFNDFPLGGGPVKQVGATVNPPVIILIPPAISGGQVQLGFNVTAGPAYTFHLLQADQLSQAWTTNTAAVLTTNVSGSSYRFTTTNGPAARFYRVRTP